MGARSLGIRVHSAAEAYWKDGEDPVEVHDRLARRDVTIADTDPNTPPWAMDQMYQDVVLGRNCCRAFRNWIETEGPYDGYSIHGVEQVLDMEIMPGVVLRGRADLVLQREVDGALFVDDLKTTTRYRAGVRESLERSYQHYVYLALLHSMNPDEIIGGAFYTVLFKLKNPETATTAPLERWLVPATRRAATMRLAQLREIVTEILRLMNRTDTVGAAAAFPTPQDRCRWCDFRQPCQMYDENPLGARAMLDAEFQRGGRHSRYAREDE